MTYVRAEALDAGTFMRSDIAVSVMRGSVIERQFPLPKILILDPSFVIGIAGSDPQGGLRGLLTLWAACDSAATLRAAIREDGGRWRQFLMLESSGDVWRYDDRRWTGPRREGWIGSQQARQNQDPEPFRIKIADLSEAEREAWRETARAMEFDEETIEAVLSGEVERELGAEISQLNAMRSAGRDVSEFMIEARLVDGEFLFAPQSPIVKVLGSQVLQTENDVASALLGRGAAVSHRFVPVKGANPSVLTIEFLGAKVTFAPCMNYGYSHRVEILDPASQVHLHM